MRNLIQLLARRWQSIPLMDRWLLSELIGPLLFGIAAFTAVTLSVGVVFELVRKVAESGLSIAVATQVLFLKLPGFLVLSFPMATLMATLLAYSRLSGGSELTALRSIGVSTMRFVLPAIFLAAVMSGLTFMFNDLIVPPANRSGYVTLQKALGRSIDSEKGENIIYPRYGKVVGSSSAGDKERLVHLFYARDYFNGAMVDVTLLDFSRPNSRQMLTAKLARYDQKSGNWEFINGNVINISENGGMNTTAEFDSYFYPLGQGPLDLAELPRDANNMTVAQAREGLRILEQAGDRKEARKLRVRIQEKFSFPAICLVFGLIGASLGSRPNGRTSRSQGFGISVLLIFLYYLLAFVFSSLGVKGTLTPLLSAWSPVLIGLVGGTYLLREASQ